MRPEDWARLGAAMEGEMPFPPPYQRIDVSGLAEPAVFDADVAYHGDWTEGLAPLDTVAQVRIRPRWLKHRGRLVAPEIVDCEAELIAALDRLDIAWSHDGDVIRVPAAQG